MNEVTITHRADPTVSYKPNLNRLGEATSLEEELPNMDTKEELKAHLMATDEEYRRLAAEHSTQEDETSIEGPDGSDREPVAFQTGRLNRRVRCFRRFGPVWEARSGLLIFRGTVAYAGKSIFG
jgi:alkylhydroperoxidase family enzyme